MARNTFNVDEFRETVNNLLASKDSTINGRIAAQALLCDILHKTGNYDGFKYLRQNEVPEGELPGIIFDESEERNHQYPDKTRCRYY